MTAEQYYWLIRRRQLAEAQRSKIFATGRRNFRFERTDCPYLFGFASDGNYDEDAVNRQFENYGWVPAGGRCSSIRYRNFHGRNYDWTFDQAPTIVVTTPKTDKHAHATLGVATLMHLKASQIRDGFLPGFEFIECALVDGINDCKLACNLNVVPPGDNPRYPTLESERQAYAEGKTYTEVANVTFGTNPGKPRRFVGQICRTILDNCASVAEAKSMIMNDYSWYAARNLKGEFFEEFHVMISDLTSTAVVEFVGNKAVVHEWTADGLYVGCSDPELAVKRQCPPVMTNFYLSGWDGRVDNLGISESIPLENRNETVTEFGMGYERYVMLDDLIKNNPEGWTDDEFAQKAMERVRYRQMYYADWKEWTSEFLSRESGLNYRSDMLNSEDYRDFRARALAKAEQEDADDAMGIRPEKSLTWQTVHNSTYDLNSMTLTVFPHEKYGKPYVVSLNA